MGGAGGPGPPGWKWRPRTPQFGREWPELAAPDPPKTTRNELNYINTFKSWINNIFTDHKKDLNFNYFVLNQNEILFKLIE